ncbi:Diphthamide biosynthesis protein 4 [Ilyonectria robusta]|uniref:Diphthamide biosynthesis protein 4 n=1 Tax=Ilyonectria robusta TaxID=1079257 RepID=UPI001E8CB2A4|nr:Diphthamide biosynthesis protein 4 [Ilyonectria robusta]KAH8737604.1 Diphthamide biosynthesis protein 4 [Ilyonectria robusta]
MAAAQPVDGVTHYQVLNLTPTLIDTQHDPTALIKRAYHRALLRNHPDKVSASPASTSFTIDQITTALTVLSSRSSRTAYDTALRVSRPAANAQSRDATFQTGVENVDLDDLAYDDAKECWYRPCRCGNDRSYIFRETDLEEVGDEGELVVACLDCSLWLRVHFAVVDDDEVPEPAAKEKS